MVMTEGAVGNLEAVEGLLVPWPFVVEDIVQAGGNSLGHGECQGLYLVTLCGVRPLVLMNITGHLIQSYRVTVTGLSDWGRIART